METTYKDRMKARMNFEGKEWTAKVINLQQLRQKIVKIITNFSSKTHTIENIAHKVELDLMTNLHYKFITPIVIQIKEVKGWKKQGCGKKIDTLNLNSKKVGLFVCGGKEGYLCKSCQEKKPEVKIKI